MSTWKWFKLYAAYSHQNFIARASAALKLKPLHRRIAAHTQTIMQIHTHTYLRQQPGHSLLYICKLQMNLSKKTIFECRLLWYSNDTLTIFSINAINFSVRMMICTEGVLWRKLEVGDFEDLSRRPSFTSPIPGFQVLSEKKYKLRKFRSLNVISALPSNFILIVSIIYANFLSLGASFAQN